jgi:glutamate--cysteine ligase catalytic subunit
MRLKLPPEPESKIGWRVEFRAMELQLTDDENSAFSILV